LTRREVRAINYFINGRQVPRPALAGRARSLSAGRQEGHNIKKTPHREATPFRVWSFTLGEGIKNGEGKKDHEETNKATGRIYQHYGTCAAVRQDHLKKIAVEWESLFVMVAAFVLFRVWEEKKENEASQRLNLAMETVQQVILPTGRDRRSSTRTPSQKWRKWLKLFPEPLQERLLFFTKGISTSSLVNLTKPLKPMMHSWPRAEVKDSIPSSPSKESVMRTKGRRITARRSRHIKESLPWIKGSKQEKPGCRWGIVTKAG